MSPGVGPFSIQATKSISFQLQRHSWKLSKGILSRKLKITSSIVRRVLSCCCCDIQPFHNIQLKLIYIFDVCTLPATSSLSDIKTNPFLSLVIALNDEFYLSFYPTAKMDEFSRTRWIIKYKKNCENSQFLSSQELDDGMLDAMRELLWVTKVNINNSCLFSAFFPIFRSHQHNFRINSISYHQQFLCGVVKKRQQKTKNWTMWW